MNLNDNKLIDLHTHTCYSDGDMMPDELLKEAIKNNIKTISITDHDTIQGLQALTYDYKDSINLIPGIELSAKVNHGRMHILGYGIDIYNEELNEKTKELKTNSINSVLSVMEQIKRDYGIIFTYDEIKELVNTVGNVGRPNLAKLCIKNEYAKTVQEAFDKYLIPAYEKIRTKNKGLQPKQCIELIIKSGGIPILAHPKSLELNDKEFLIVLKELISYGLCGIEAYHSSFSKEDTKKYLTIAHDLNLLISGGTDYHGKSVKPDIELGTGKNKNLKIKKLSILEEIKNGNHN